VNFSITLTATRIVAISLARARYRLHCSSKTCASQVACSPRSLDNDTKPIASGSRGFILRRGIGSGYLWERSPSAPIRVIGHQPGWGFTIPITCTPNASRQTVITREPAAKAANLLQTSKSPNGFGGRETAVNSHLLDCFSHH
jgi:hypothetical protein